MLDFIEGIGFVGVVIILIIGFTGGGTFFRGHMTLWFVYVLLGWLLIIWGLHSLVDYLF